jgi:cell volume regulation protein A
MPLVSNVDQFLLSLAAILALGSVGGFLFSRLSIPDAVWLIGAGVVLGPILGFLQRDTLTAIAPFFGALTIIVVLFEGGSRLQLVGVLTSAPRAGVVALVGFVVSTLAGAVAVLAGVMLGILPSDWSWQYGALIGLTLGGSSSVVVMPAVIQANLSEQVSNLVSLESALTDILCVVGATSMVAIMVATGPTSTGPALEIATTFGVGVVAGLAAGLVSVPFARFLRPSPYAYPLLLAALLSLYVVVDLERGSAPLAVLVFALLLGNLGLRVPGDGAHLVGSLDEATRSVHSQVTFVVKAFFFTFIGAMLGRPSIELAFGVVLGLVLVAARLVAMRGALLGSPLTVAERRVVSVLGPRGLAAGVLATFPLAAGLPDADPIPVVVYGAVVTTILVFAVALPLARRGSAPVVTAAPAPEPVTMETS